MTPHSSAQGVRENFDTGPLSWVMGEIREALTRSKTAIHEAVAQDSEAQSTSLRHAKTYLHQAHGALQIVDIDGVPLITEAIEDMLGRIDSGALAFSETVATAIGSAYQAVIEYLEDLLSGASHQPVKLFPYWKDLIDARGEGKAHPSDLFFPNVGVRVQLSGDHASIRPIDQAALRQRYERTLLPFLKSTDRQAELANVSAMGNIIAEVEQAQTDQRARAFWWVMRGFTEAVAAGQTRNEVYVKQLFARINIELRKLGEGPTAAADRLLRDALFFIAAAAEPSTRLKQIRAAYQLEGQVPSDYLQKRYGQIDVHALVNAKEHLAQAKNIWNRIVGGDASASDAFHQEMANLAQTGGKLNSAPLGTLLNELAAISREVSGRPHIDALGIEIATSLLFVENALNHTSRLSEDFAGRAEAMAARIRGVVAGERPAESSEWLDDMSRQAQQRQTMQVLASEMQASLGQVEKSLDEFFTNPSKHSVLEPIDGVLHQLEGALFILDQDDAIRAVRHTRAAVTKFAGLSDDAVPDKKEFQQVAQNVGALSFFIETLQFNPDGIKERFSFDDARGTFQAKLLNESARKDVVVEMQAEAPVTERLRGSANPESVQSGIVAPKAEAAAPAVPAAIPAIDIPVAAAPTVPSPDSASIPFDLSMPLDIAMPKLDGEAPLSSEAGSVQEQAFDISFDLQSGDNRSANEITETAETAGTAADGMFVIPEDLKLPEIAESDLTLTVSVASTEPAPEQIRTEKPAAPAAMAAPVTDEAIDAELLEIFLTEAEEVLDCVRQTLPKLKNEAHNQEHMTTLRRSFHTLKGSGRMVGLMAFGEAAWSIEQVMNLRLSEGKGGSPDLYALLEHAADSMGEWVAELQSKGHSSRHPASLIRAAERVKKDEAFYVDDDADGAVAQSAAEAPDQGLTMTAPAGSSDTVPAVPEDVAAIRFDIKVEPEPLIAPIELAPVSAFEMPASADGFAVSESDSVPSLPQVEETPMSDLDMAAFHFQDNSATISSARINQEATAPNATPAADSAETLFGEFALDAIELTAALPVETETPKQEAISAVESIELVAPVLAEEKIDDNIKRIGDLEISVPLHNIYLAETDELVRLLANDVAEWRHESERSVNILAVHAAHSLAGSSATVGFEPLQEVAYALEMVLQSLARTPLRLNTGDFDMLENGIACLKQMLQKFALCEMPDREPNIVQTLRGLQADLRARTGGKASEVQSSVPAFDAATADIDTPQIAVDVAAQPVAEPEAIAVPAIETMEPMPAIAAARVAPERIATPTAKEEPLFERAAAHEIAIAAPNDELDADLLPVFIEEANDILPQMGQHLRAWHQNPKDTAAAQALLRLLHTIKGSARMAGAMRIGQHMHEMESRIEQITRLGVPSVDALEELLGRLDLGLYMFDQLVNPDASRPAPIVHAPGQQADSVQQSAAPSGNASTQAVVLNSVMPVADSHGIRTLPASPVHDLAAHQAAPASAAQVPLIRVRADILDRLVNQAGEVSISRSRVETEVDTLRQSLLELTENVTRLRGQLREIEIQAESQMASQMAHSIDREFDPLEFDRFTRLQELTRMMAESVNDVASVQYNLTRTIDGATVGLSAQARLTRDLQQDLMRVRMVQFASVSERLFRVTRQAAKEMDKRVNLDIRGGGVEMDRSVLEKMAGPFEHLLRNSIVHGIESRQARVAAGKSETGELLVEIRQEGNEVVIQFSDDGQGLNLTRIREKAKATGLITDDTAVSDAELRDLIFHPGFSTAQEITELAGRGVGMDVVRSEAAALGGRVAVISEPGKGARFIIQLPLTLAVTQVVLLSTGGKTYAVPSVLVEQVQQLKANALAAAYNDGAVMWHGSRVALHYLSALLGDTTAAPLAQQYSPLVILKSGTDRVAVHVDEVVGNREVVVKNIGPQLARMIGIAGATVMGSGDIVLIIDPVPLALRLAQEGVRAPRLLPSDAPDDMGAVAEMASSTPVEARPQPVQGLRTQSIVMVVDDSLTVRRVTQRFLTREGYQVVLAKDGVDALEQLQAITPDVMLVDIEMPRMDGFDLTRNIRSDERTRHIPIIMITSRTATKHRNYAMELGVNEYLGKPYQESDLIRLITGFVNKEIQPV